MSETPERDASARASRGRGVAGNPANRFTAIERVPDPEWLEVEEPKPTTEFLCDASRTIISTNDSPDIGFTASLNPYRGCEHGCAYCLSGETLILMADGTTKRLENIRVGDHIYGTIRRGWYRRYVKTQVLDHWRVTKPAYRVRLEDGTELIASGDHRFLTERGWKFVTGDHRPHLTMNNKLMGIGGFVPLQQKDEEYKRGYMCGLIRGDGHLAFYPYERTGRSHGHQYQFRLALTDDEALERAREYLSGCGVVTHTFLFQEASNGRKRMRAIRTHARGNVERIGTLTAWEASPSVDWRRGFLAGIFDAEGSYSGGILRITNTDRHIIDHASHSLERLGFSFVVEHKTPLGARAQQVIRLRGGLSEHLRFFHSVDPAITRKRNIEGQAVKSSAHLRVVSVEPIGVARPLYDITTGTGDFIANGVVSHNCYARPTHEYLGYSAGLDFETKIMVKERAPELLREELSRPNWQPKVLAISGVTDPYQPVERRLQITRRCLAVLAEFRNPVGIVTKNALVTRDIDLLAELARHDAAAVFISVTTLDAGLCGVLEPRTSRPAKRLEAVRRLTDAGVPVGVMVAPVIPGLTDHEIPAIIEAAAKAGAKRAGMVPLRLPYAVKDLFEAWLEQHAPEKKQKVLNRIRAIRGGRLNDPRFGSRMRGEGVFAEQIKALFTLACKRAGLNQEDLHLSTAHFRRPVSQATGQLSLF